MTTTRSAEVLLIDGTPRPDRTWWVTSFRPGDRIRLDSLGPGSFTVTHSAEDEDDPRLWRLDLTVQAEPAVTMRLPPRTQAVGEEMVRTLTAKCFFRDCESIGEVTAEVGALGSPHIKTYVCAKH
ncbi:hypothetical protein AB0N77_20610 [Streptomyces misionensis]|uniref:hypothetical protein n=1 Tax=Streptomyces misionensis TaxID=67331 RepID=UPI0034434061